MNRRDGISTRSYPRFTATLESEKRQDMAIESGISATKKSTRQRINYMLLPAVLGSGNTMGWP